jgi:predicted MFS family arabinose efflux permease
MSRSSTSDEVEKELALDKEVERTYQTEQEEDLVDASRRPFTVDEDIEKSAANGPTDNNDGASLTKVQSEKPSVNNIKSVPNGGGTAWLQVLCSFFVFFNTWGIINAFGIYQTYYETSILQDSSPSDISWIGSLEAFLLMIVGSIAGPIYDKGYVRELLGIGSFLIVFGQMMLSLCTEYWQVLLAQGFSIGIGTGCIFVSGVAILSTYFSTKLATATGIAATGSSIGGVLYPVIFYKLQPQIGFAWATRVLGFIAFATLLVSNLTLRIRVIPASRRKFLDLPAWRIPAYLFFNVGSFFTFIGLYAPFFYIQSFVLSEGLMGHAMAFYLLSILNGASTFGRFIPNIIADYVGPFNVLTPCALMCGILQYCLIAADTSASVIVLMVFYGFFSGTLVSLPATCYVHLAGPTRRGLIGTWMGMGFAFVSLGMLCGTPITGAILNASSFKYVWVFGGTLMLIGSIFIILARFAQGNWKFLVKV